ncbi:hypothetical protein JYQ62_20800 [Nostoc sp. UHCC 0702]|nr:hypothetical protein JYQ62_20800 [Nostoc sp. UHCC 0702]
MFITGEIRAPTTIWYHCQWLVVSCQLLVVSCQLSVVSGQLSVVSCQWSVVSCQLSVVILPISLSPHLPIFSSPYTPTVAQ